METLYFFILVLTVLVLAYKRVPLLIAMATMVVLTIVWTELRHLFYVPSWFRFANGIVAVTLIGFSITPLRRLLISDRLYGLFRKLLPRVSSTEQEALDVLGTERATAMLAAGEFPAGSMGPKIESALTFIEQGGDEVVITSPEHILAAIEGREGTRIVAG